MLLDLTASRTGSILRKAADVINSGDTRKIVVIMDDREVHERAKVEADILSTMVSVMPFTRLVSQVPGGNVSHKVRNIPRSRLRTRVSRY
jgi:hypothetical protein